MMAALAVRGVRGAKKKERWMTKEELEAKVGTAFAELVKSSSILDLVVLQRDLRKTQPEDKDYLRLVLLELKERDNKKETNG